MCSRSESGTTFAVYGGIWLVGRRTYRENPANGSGRGASRGPAAPPWPS